MSLVPETPATGSQLRPMITIIGDVGRGWPMSINGDYLRRPYTEIDREIEAVRGSLMPTPRTSSIA